MKKQFHPIEKEKILKLVEEIGYENDECKKLDDIEVKFTFGGTDDMLFVGIADRQTSRGSHMWFLGKHWSFSKNFWLTQRNLKLLNAINEVVLDDRQYFDFYPKDGVWISNYTDETFESISKAVNYITKHGKNLANTTYTVWRDEEMEQRVFTRRHGPDLMPPRA